MHASLDLNDGSFVDEAARLGVFILVKFNDDAISVINTYKDKPAILGWNVADDVDNGKKTADQILQLHKKVKLADPRHITYISGSYPSKIGQLINTADLFGMQSYPVDYEPLSSTHYTISSAVNAAALYNRPVIANLQTFVWQGRRSPTFKELRNMTYQALIGDVKGIIYYSYYDPTWDI
jgi:hypothetical protein